MVKCKNRFLKRMLPATALAGLFFLSPAACGRPHLTADFGRSVRTAMERQAANAENDRDCPASGLPGVFAAGIYETFKSGYGAGNSRAADFVIEIRD